jgi:hypothetical protein
MTPLSTIHFCIQYLKDTIHDVMPVEQEFDSYGRDEYSRQCKAMSAWGRYV